MHAGSAEETERLVKMIQTIMTSVMSMEKISSGVADAFTIINAQKAHFAVLFRKSALIMVLSVAINVKTSMAAEHLHNAVHLARRLWRASHMLALVRTINFLSNGFQDVHLIHVTLTHADRENNVLMMNWEDQNVFLIPILRARCRRKLFAKLPHAHSSVSPRMIAHAHVHRTHQLKLLQC